MERHLALPATAPAPWDKSNVMPGGCCDPPPFPAWCLSALKSTRQQAHLSCLGASQRAAALHPLGQQRAQHRPKQPTQAGTPRRAPSQPPRQLPTGLSPGFSTRAVDRRKPQNPDLLYQPSNTLNPQPWPPGPDQTLGVDRESCVAAIWRDSCRAGPARDMTMAAPMIRHNTWAGHLARPAMQRSTSHFVDP